MILRGLISSLSTKIGFPAVGKKVTIPPLQSKKRYDIGSVIQNDSNKETDFVIYVESRGPYLGPSCLEPIWH